jgi:hypothetical protein
MTAISKNVNYITLAGIYQSSDETNKARSVLENATSIVHPGPFDDEIDDQAVKIFLHSAVSGTSTLVEIGSPRVIRFSISARILRPDVSLSGKPLSVRSVFSQEPQKQVL